MTVEAQRLQPEFAWPVKFSDEEARTLVNHRLKKRADLKTTLYHHPFLGLVFQGQQHRARFFPQPSRQRETNELIQAHVLVDLVGGKAYLSDAWETDDFIAISPNDETSPIRDPEPQVQEATAILAARAILAGVVLRRRRIAAVNDFELVEPPARLGKPNWWVTDRHTGGSTEVIVDGITGKHYAFSV